MLFLQKNLEFKFVMYKMNKKTVYFLNKTRFNIIFKTKKKNIYIRIADVVSI